MENYTTKKLSDLEILNLETIRKIKKILNDEKLNNAEKIGSIKAFVDDNFKTSFEGHNL